MGVEKEELKDIIISSGKDKAKAKLGGLILVAMVVVVVLMFIGTLKGY